MSEGRGASTDDREYLEGLKYVVGVVGAVYLIFLFVAAIAGVATALVFPTLSRDRITIVVFATPLLASGINFLFEGSVWLTNRARHRRTMGFMRHGVAYMTIITMTVVIVGSLLWAKK